MQIVAVSSQLSSQWRWRIVSRTGRVVEESVEEFATIPEAVAAGLVRLDEMNGVDDLVRRC